MSCALNTTTTCQFIQTQLQYHSNWSPKMMNMCLRASRTLTSTPLSLTFSPSKHPSYLKPSFLSKSYSSRSFSVKMSTTTTTIEHIVLFKVKDDTDPTKVNSLVNGLNGLTSQIDNVVHLTAGPIHKNRSTAFTFTHMLHSRYNSKEDLANYSAHPSHIAVVKESVLPICDDIMAVDWVNSDVNGTLTPKPGSAMRVTFLKLKEGLGDSEKYEVLGITKGVKEYFPSIEQSSVGENFSPTRAKGFSIGSIAVYPGLSELENAVSSNPEIAEAQKAKARQYLDGVIVVDYVIPSPSSSQQSASL